jgi:hypothetical protein
LDADLISFQMWFEENPGEWVFQNSQLQSEAMLENIVG